MTRRIQLPKPVTRIYKAAAELEKMYPERTFPLDGHLLGSIGEVVAAKVLRLKLHPMSQPRYDAYDENGEVQIKITAGKNVSLNAKCDRLVVLRVVSPREAEIVYDGPGRAVWRRSGRRKNNNQRTISLSRLRSIGTILDDLKSLLKESKGSRR